MQCSVIDTWLPPANPSKSVCPDGYVAFECLFTNPEYPPLRAREGKIPPRKIEIADTGERPDFADILSAIKRSKISQEVFDHDTIAAAAIRVAQELRPHEFQWTIYGTGSASRDVQTVHPNCELDHPTAYDMHRGAGIEIVIPLRQHMRRA